MSKALKELQSFKGSVGWENHNGGKRLKWKLREGKTTIKSLTAQTPELLLPKVTQFLAERELGIETKKELKSKVTVKDALDYYYESQSTKTPSLRDKTLETYRNASSKLKPLHGIRLTELTFERLKQYRHGGESSDSSYELKFLRSAISYAVNPHRGLVPGLPHPMLDADGKIDAELRPRPMKKGARGGKWTPPENILELEEYFKTARAVPNGKGEKPGFKKSAPTRNYLRLLWAQSNSGRLGENGAAMVKDLEVINGRLHVHFRRQADGKGGWTPHLKSSASYRTVPLTDDGIFAVTERLRELKEIGCYHPDAILFSADIEGKRTLGETAFRQALIRACKKIGIPPVTPHNLRGNWASWLLMLNPDIPLKTFQRLGGWAELKTAQECYETYHPRFAKATENLNLNMGAAKRIAAQISKEEPKDVLEFLEPQVETGVPLVT